MRRITMTVKNAAGEPARVVLTADDKGGFIARGRASVYQIKKALAGLMKPGTVIRKGE